MALAVEDKEGHLFICECRAALFRGECVFDFAYFDSYTVLLKLFITITEIGMGRGERKKKKV